MIFIDSNIFMYAAGKSSPQREPSQELLRKIVKGTRESYCTNSEVLQEILHRYIAIGEKKIGFRIVEHILVLNIPILPVEKDDVMRAKILLEEFHTLSTRDAVHIGVMQGRSFQRVITYDRDFSLVPWVQRIEP